MTKIVYGYSYLNSNEGFSLTTSNLVDYVKTAQSHKNFYKNEKWHCEHTDGVIASFIHFLAEGKFHYNKYDRRTNQAIKDLIREYGCDKDGIYSETAKKALKNVYTYQGLNPADAILKNRHPQADWKETFSAITTMTSSLKTNTSISLKNFARKCAAPFRFIAKSAKNITTGNKQRINNFTNSAKDYWNRKKYYLAGAAGIAAFIGLGFFAKSSNSAQKDKQSSAKTEIRTDTTRIANLQQVSLSANQYKTNTDTLQQSATAQKTYVWQPQAMLSQQIEHAQQKADSLSKILENKIAYRQARTPLKAQDSANTHLTPQDSIENEAYISSLNLHGKNRAQKLIQKVENQINNGIFSAEQGLTKERIAHAYLMCSIYQDADKDGTKIVLDAVNSQEKLTPEQQKAFTDYIINNVGERGTTLQKLSIQKGNRNHHSAYNNASRQLQRQHIRNLQQVRALHNR